MTTVPSTSASSRAGRASHATPGTRAAVFVAVALITSVAALSAHRRDEYLQAARIGVEPDRIDIALDLTPGIDVAPAVIGDMDRNHDGVVSAGEQSAYAARVAAALSLELDGRALHIDTIATQFPDLPAMLGGVGTVQLTMRASLPAVVPGKHELAFRNVERRDVSVYLANALVPESRRVSVNGQRRDLSQSALIIDFTLGADAARWPPSVFGGLAGAAVLGALLLRTGFSRPH
jgi:hypothetical protein